MILCILSAAILGLTLPPILAEPVQVADGGSPAVSEAPAIHVYRREVKALGLAGRYGHRRESTRFEAVDSFSAAAVGASAGAVPFRGTVSTSLYQPHLAGVHHARKERAMHYFRPCRNAEMRGAGRDR